MRRGTRRGMWLLVLMGVVGLAVLLASPPANAQMKSNEWYVAGFVGGGFPLEDNFKIEGTQTSFSSSGPGSSSTDSQKLRDVFFQSSPVVGAKGGLCPGRFPNFCVELEFDHFTLNTHEQERKGSETNISGSSVFTSNRPFIDTLDVEVWNLGLNLIGRWPFLPEAGYPLGGRLHAYAGAGPAFVWTHLRDTETIVCCSGSDTAFTVGVDALAGVKFFITKNLALFGEYKFKHWSPSFEFSSSRFSTFSPGGFSGSSGTTKIKDLDFNVNLFYVGLALHFP